MMLQTRGSDVARHLAARTSKAPELIDGRKVNGFDTIMTQPVAVLNMDSMVHMDHVAGPSISTGPIQQTQSGTAGVD
jgi:hypothetical protein